MKAYLFRYFLLFILSFTVATETVAATKHALVIGLGKYQDPSWDKINGDRDVPLVVEMLSGLGYRDIVTLVNEEATKMQIASAFRQLSERCAVGDVVYIHFSGHGQRMTDVNGDEVKDRWDESWIPYDAYLEYGQHDRGEKHISDDEVGVWMTEIRKKVGKRGQIVLAVDACHSGDSSREGDGIPVRGVIRNFIIPGDHDRTAPRQAEHWLTLSACKHFQRNCEVATENGFYGMLTYALYSQHHQFKGKDNGDILRILSRFVDCHRGVLPQSPVLTGDMKKYEMVNAFYD